MVRVAFEESLLDGAAFAVVDEHQTVVSLSAASVSLRLLRVVQVGTLHFRSQRVSRREQRAFCKAADYSAARLYAPPRSPLLTAAPATDQCSLQPRVLGTEVSASYTFPP